VRQFKVDQLWEIGLGDFPVFGDQGGRPEPLLVLRGVDDALCSFLRRTDDFVLNRVCFDGLHTSPYVRSDAGVGVSEPLVPQTIPAGAVLPRSARGALPGLISHE